MSISDWFRQFRKPELDVPDVMRPAHDVDTLRRRRAAIEKSRYHFVRLNDMLSQYHNTKVPDEKERLRGSISRRVTMLKHLGVELPTDYRKMQLLTSELVALR